MRIKINNGVVVSPTEVYKADIGIEDGIITKIEQKAKTDASDLLVDFNADNVIDADNQYVLPGGVDVHTHFDMPFGGTVTADNFYTGTVAAACGGTTTIIDFAIQNKGESLKKTLDTWHKKAANRAVVDYAFHIAITDVTDTILSEIPSIIDEGVTSFKLFMAYKGSIMVSDESIDKVLKKSGQLGFLTMLHCEDGEKIDKLVKKMLARGETATINHALSRPTELEVLAIARAMQLATKSNGNLYVVHLSSEEGLKIIKKTQETNKNIFVETCPQYLILAIDKYTDKPEKKGDADREDRLPDDFEGAKYVMSPPLRGRHNLLALWNGIKDGSVNVVSSDHCAFNFNGQKSLGLNDFSKIPNGIPGVETRLNLLFEEGVNGKRININKLVDVFSTTPAKLFGLYPKKGEVKIGSDADIVIFNPVKRFTLKSIKLHQDVDYCPFEDYKGNGKISYVISNGEIIVKDHVFCGTRGSGKFLKRDKITFK